MMVIFGETKVAKKKFYDAKKSINIWDVNIDDIILIIFCLQKLTLHNFMIHIKSVPSKDQNQYIIMLVFGEVKVAKENFYGSKQSINIWDINIDNNFI